MKAVAVCRDAPVKDVTVEAVVIRADGRREDLGVVARMEEERKGKPRRMALVSEVVRFLGIRPHILILLLLWVHLALASVLTNAGRDILTNRIKGSGTEPNYVHWGTGAGTAVVGSTSLFTAASEARVAGTSTRVTTTVTNDTYQVVGTLTADGSKTITNVGLFDASSGGNLFVHADHGGIALTLNDAIQYTIKVQFT